MSDDAKIITFPGVPERDWDSWGIDDEGVLTQAVKNGVRSVVVVGRTPEGELYVASSCENLEEVLGRLHVAASYLGSMRAIEYQGGDAQEDEDDGA